MFNNTGGNEAKIENMRRRKGKEVSISSSKKVRMWVRLCQETKENRGKVCGKSEVRRGNREGKNGMIIGLVSR